MLHLAPSHDASYDSDGMLDRLAEFITRYKMLPVGTRVGIAVSGGADSVFLLHALHELGPRWNLHLSVIHIEHGIRGQDSKADAAFVEQLAASFALPFHLKTANVPQIDDNQEQAARRVRQDFYSELIKQGEVDRVATGHTRNDQAETVLYRIMRGSGIAGLSGILPVTNEGIVRPLLELDRSEIEAWLRNRNVAWREDATNQDRAYARNRLRHDILPLLRSTFNPRLDETLANMATLAQDEESYWDSTLQPPATSRQPLVLETSALTSVPPAVARRRIRNAIQAVKGDLRQIDFAHVERILEMARSENGHDRTQIPDLDVVRSFDWIRIGRPEPAEQLQGYAVPLQVPGTVELPGACARITLQVLEKSDFSQPCGKVVNELDWQRLTSLSDVPPSLEVRNWRPGDEYRPAGKPNEQKIKFLFQDARVPSWERGNWPIITYNETIVWSKRFGAAAEFAAGPSTRVVVRVEVSNECGYLSGTS
jgi:tRNA(Ile)-lysidine synthase